MIYEIYHETKFDYAGLVTFSHNMARLKPKDCSTQKLLEYSLTINPNPSETNEFIDYFENTNNYMVIREAHKCLKVIATSKVQRVEDEISKELESLKNIKLTFKELKQRLGSYHSENVVLAKYFLFETESIPTASNEIKEYALESFKDDRNIIEAASEFTARIFNDFKFVSGFSDITTPIEVIFKEKKGVCQDFAQFAISALRSIGIPTRYVSGYIQTHPAEGKEKLFGADASHAWFSIYVPDFGWADFDPTNNKIPDVQYIILGHGRDYLDISPLKGVVQSSSASSLLSVSVDVKVLD